MPDTVVLADARAARFARRSDEPVELVGRSAAIARVQELVRRAAQADGGALLIAEPGTAVDSVARELHLRSKRAASAYVSFSCGAQDPANIERLLFGAPAPGAATDLEPVSSDSPIAAARGGTLFLQDICELPAAAQARLARVTRDGEVRIDGVRVATGFRLIASASSGIEADVHAHRFRADLYRRVSAVRIDLPPLRERGDDLPILAERLLDDVCVAEGRPPRTFTQAALALVGALTWPGNLIELRTAIERIVADSRDDVIQIEHLLPVLDLHRAPPPMTPVGNLREARLRFERDYIASVLQHHRWSMADAAQTLGIQRPNLYRKARQLGIPLSRVSE